jgi:hypothetical protein
MVRNMIFGYLDAGSGSLLLQALLGGAAGIAVAFRAWKSRITGKRLVEEAQAGLEAEETTTRAQSES